MSYLDAILERKRIEVAARRREVSLAEVESALPSAKARGFRSALSASTSEEPTRVIAEIKRASPSAGTIDGSLDAPTMARRYVDAGAAAISVLTDGPGFGGSLDDLRAVRAAVELPLLRKDFVVDRYQLVEARAAGADAALLIVAALAPAELAELLRACETLGLDALVEVHDEPELEQALAAGARLVGINNRNLKSFQVDLGTTERLAPQIPSGVVVVAESGVRNAADAARLRAAGAPNLLVGEALVRAPSAAALLRELVEAR